MRHYPHPTRGQEISAYLFTIIPYYNVFTKKFCLFPLFLQEFLILVTPAEAGRRNDKIVGASVTCPHCGAG